MYVREKTIKRGKKEYSYYQLVEGERVDGRVRQRVIKHLGRLPTREHADMVVRQMGLLCSVLKCGRRGTIERLNPKMRIKVCAQHDATSRRGETLLVYPLF
jgi:hypothetical protein